MTTWDLKNDKAGWSRVARSAIIKASALYIGSNVGVIEKENPEDSKIVNLKEQIDRTYISDEERLTRRKIVAEMERSVEDSVRLEADSWRAAWVDRDHDISNSCEFMSFESLAYYPRLDQAAASAAAAAALAQVASEAQQQLRHSASERARRAAEVAVVTAEAALLREWLDALKQTAIDSGFAKEVELCSLKVEDAAREGRQKDLQVASAEVEALAEAITTAITEQQAILEEQHASEFPESVEDILDIIDEEVVIDGENEPETFELAAEVESTSSSSVNRQAERKSCIDYLAKYLEDKESAIEEIATGVKWKTVRRDCQRAVNLAVNAISSTSSSHLKDKFSRLCDLLDGRSVPLAGGETFCSRRAHPRAIDYCTLLLAKKVVKVGEDVVSSHPDTAFAVASVTARLAGRFPRFAALLLAQFHRTCQLLVPEAPSSGETKPGARDDEDHDKWLKRMSGAARMLGAVLVSRVGAVKSPLGVAEAWAWLASFLSLDPLPDISATLLLDMLEVTGHRLLSHYGFAFQKLLYLVCTTYVPRIEGVTALGRGGPVQRLKTFLEDVIRDQRIPAPKGFLPKEFW